MTPVSWAETAVLYEGQRTRVVRATDPDGRRVILKQLRAHWPTPAELSRLQREHDLLLRLEGARVPRVLSFEKGDVAQLVTEDLEATVLADWMAEARRSAVAAVEVALGVAQALAEIHARDVVHRDINPSNIVGDPSTRRMWVIDFDLATSMLRSHSGRQAPGMLTGTPAYIAPEQTGRMNRPTDARSDLYALGVTLYELFSGRLPFEEDDVLALSHAHLARTVPPLRSVVPGLPDQAAELVAALLEKRPEDRYQSSAGLVLDLRRLLDALPGRVRLTWSGRQVSDRLELSGDLRGRVFEVERLQSAFEAARSGSPQVILVSGEAGIGKTTLVRELQRPVTLAGGRFVEGKFGQFSRDTPYVALSQVLTAFGGEVLALPTRELDDWRDRLTSATAPNTGLLIELAPSLEVLTGPQPAVPELPPSEAERRLHDTLVRALTAVVDPDRPLVVFLDDLQWADLASLRALEAIWGAGSIRHTLFVCAYREEEPGAEAHLRPTLQLLEERRVPLTRTRLGALSSDEVTEILAGALRRSPDDLVPLAEVLHRLSGGNPFYLRHLTVRANESGAIWFDPEALEWEFDVASVGAMGLADNVASLLEREIGSQAGDVRICLAAAAQVGEAFGVRDLALATSLEPARIRQAVGVAIERHFLQPLDSDWWDQAPDPDHAFRFAFAHDKVQRAARSLLSDDEAARMHLALARGQAQRPDEEASHFRRAEHYLAASSLLTDAEERVHAARILLEAGSRAMGSAAHAPAHRYLEAAVELGTALWDVEPETARRAWQLAARAAWVAGRSDLIAEHVSTLRERASRPIERLQAEETVVQTRISEGDLHGALDTAVEVLREAGVDVPRHPTPEDVSTAIGETLAMVGERDLDAIASLVCDDDTERATRRLLVRICSAAYVAEPNILPLVACHLVRRTLTMGATPESAYGFAVFALCLCAGWLLGPGTALGRMAIGLYHRFPDRTLEGAIRHVVNHYPRVWDEPLREIYDESPDVIRALLGAGDLEYAGWSWHLRVVYGFFSGVPLDTLAEEVEEATSFMRRHSVVAALECTLPFEQLVRALRGESAEASRLVGEGYDEAVAFARHTQTSFRAAALVLSVCRLTARVFARDREGAAASALETMELQDGAVAIFYQCPMRVYAAIARLDSPSSRESDAAMRAALEEVVPWREAVAAAAEHNPASAGHLLALFDAEVARARGDLAEAITRYDRAITAAGRNGFIHDEALANERAAEMHLERGADRIGLSYLEEARPVGTVGAPRRRWPASTPSIRGWRRRKRKRPRGAGACPRRSWTSRACSRPPMPSRRRPGWTFS